MASSAAAAFATPVPVSLHRASFLRVPTATPRRRCRPGTVSRASRRVMPAMQTSDVDPFTLVLTIRLKESVGASDAKAILSEYARHTSAEPSVLRSDVMYALPKTSSLRMSRSPPPSHFHIWTTFQHTHAYMSHERTAHAAKLRLFLHNPLGDSAHLLTTLAHSVRLLRPLRPHPSAWRSVLNPPSSPTTESELTSRPQSSPTKRVALDRLIANVGLEDVRILVATASATNPQAARHLRHHCEQYLSTLDNDPAVVRTGLLVDRNDPFTHTLLAVHDSDAHTCASFDLEFAADCVTDDGWRVRMHAPIFPDKIGWELFADEPPSTFNILSPSAAPPAISPAAPIDTTPSLPALLTSSSISKPPPKASPNSPGSRSRLLFGNSAFDSLKKHVRELAENRRGPLNILFISGWNEARLQPLLHQLEFDRNVDSARISFTFGVEALSLEVMSTAIRHAVATIRELKPDLLLSYGGGSVLDMAKLLSHVARCSDSELDAHLSALDAAAESDAAQVVLRVSQDPMPVMLIPTVLSPGVGITELCIAGAQRRDGEKRRFPVYFDIGEERVHRVLKTMVYDPRLVAPRRLLGVDAGQGALTTACMAMDVMMSSADMEEEHEARFLSQRALELAYKHVLKVLREPMHSSGHARDEVMKACVSCGLAADMVGRIGVCTRITLAVADAVVIRRVPKLFRYVMIRVTASVLQEVGQEEGDVGRLLREMSMRMNVNGKEDVVRQLLRRAEDCSVELLPRVGMVRRKERAVAERVGKHLSEVECSSVERLFRDVDRVERVIQQAMEQVYEL